MKEDWISPKMQQDARRLLGLREFPARTEEQKRELVGSDMRANALNTIDTTTNPRKKREVKKGVVLETIERKLISDQVLKQYPVIYIGSGTDVEYPLALGARNIVLVDPIFTHSEAVAELKSHITAVSNTQPTESDGAILQFDFDYGNGPESVSVAFIAKPYHHEMQEGDYAIPHGAGGIILYASQGPSYAVQLEKDVWDKIVPDGFILDEYILNQRNQETGALAANELGTP